jgi:hypothetical protein
MHVLPSGTSNVIASTAGLPALEYRLVMLLNVIDAME